MTTHPTDGPSELFPDNPDPVDLPAGQRQPRYATRLRHTLAKSQFSKSEALSGHEVNTATSTELIATAMK
ncbi:MAG: hypothetical protein Q9178_007971 [Gyalolechia marmorata]